MLNNEEKLSKASIRAIIVLSLIVCLGLITTLALILFAPSEIVMKYKNAGLMVTIVGSAGLFILNFKIFIKAYKELLKLFLIFIPFFLSIFAYYSTIKLEHKLESSLIQLEHELESSLRQIEHKTEENSHRIDRLLAIPGLNSQTIQTKSPIYYLTPVAKNILAKEKVFTLELYKIYSTNPNTYPDEAFIQIYKVLGSNEINSILNRNKLNINELLGIILGYYGDVKHSNYLEKRSFLPEVIEE